MLVEEEVVVDTWPVVVVAVAASRIRWVDTFAVHFRQQWSTIAMVVPSFETPLAAAKENSRSHHCPIQCH